MSDQETYQDSMASTLDSIAADANHALHEIRCGGLKGVENALERILEACNSGASEDDVGPKAAASRIKAALLLCSRAPIMKGLLETALKKLGE